MKADLLTDNFRAGLSTVSKALASKPTLPVLSNILLETKEGALVLTASDLETTITTIVGAKLSSSGALAVPGRSLLELISGLNEERIGLEEEKGSLFLVSGHFRGKFNGQPAADFPKAPDHGEKALWEIATSAFVQTMERVIFAAAADESRPVLSGVYFRPGKDEILLAAADGFRLSLDKLKVSGGKEGESFIIPAKAIAGVLRIMTEKKSVGDQSLSVSVDEGQACFTREETKIYSRLIAGKYPDFEKIIPANVVLRIIIPGNEFMSALRLAAVFARENANIIKLKIKSSKLKVIAQGKETGENETEIDIQVKEGEGEELTIAFNYRYLLDLLGMMPAEEVEWEVIFSGPMTAAIFRLPSAPDFSHLVMPIRIQEEK